MNSRISLFVQARMGSTRLPGKVLLPLGKKCVLAHLIDRLLLVQKANHLAILMPEGKKSDPLDLFLRTTYPHIDRFFGDEEDVLSRYYHAACHFHSDTIVRITSDCPLLDPKVADETIDLFFSTPGCEYASNSIKRTFPRGCDVEVFSFQALERAFHEAIDLLEREHVTLYLYRHPERFRLASLISSVDLSHLRITLDEPDDLQALVEIEKRLSGDSTSSLKDLFTLYQKEPELFQINKMVRQKPVPLSSNVQPLFEKVPTKTYSLET